ncbi:hypothetical protein [Xanthomonas hyacinthi]|nr:hypothetical protein [Xanthomonas hyacinthi]
MPVDARCDIAWMSWRVSSMGSIDTAPAKARRSCNATPVAVTVAVDARSVAAKPRVRIPGAGGGRENRHFVVVSLSNNERTVVDIQRQREEISHPNATDPLAYYARLEPKPRCGR